MKKKCPEAKGGAPEWMATYGDLVTLLMCFFVLLFAFSNIDAQKFTAVMQSFQGSAGILSGGKSFSEADLVFDGMPEDQTSNMQVINQEQLEAIKKQLEKLEKKVDEVFEGTMLEVNVEIVQTPNSLILRFKDEVLFDELSAELKNEAKGLLAQLSRVLTADDFEYDRVLVEGHTDSLTTGGEQYPTTWELSSARAVSVVRYFVEDMGLDPFKISAAGYGEYHPIATNTTEAGRAQNRRVDIIIRAGGEDEER